MRIMFLPWKFSELHLLVSTDPNQLLKNRQPFKESQKAS